MESTAVLAWHFWRFDFQRIRRYLLDHYLRAMIGCTVFVGDLLSVAVSGFIYPIIGHWAPTDGFWQPGQSAGNSSPRSGHRFADFAGSTGSPTRSVV